MKLLPLSLSVAVAITAGGTAAHAADLGVRPAYSPPPPPPPAYSWTGFYIGGNGGFGGDKFQYPFSIGGPTPALGITAATSGTASLNSSGFFGGGQAGFNWQALPAWVLGMEADFDAADIEGKATTSAAFFSGSVGTTLDWFGTVRGRVGFLVTPSALLYGTGGWAYGRTTTSANAAGLGVAAAGSIGHDKSGWTAGAGLEYAFNPWLSFKTEYLYLDLGTDALVSGAVAGVPFSVSEKTTAHTVKIGVNVKFGGW